MKNFEIFRLKVRKTGVKINNKKFGEFVSCLLSYIKKLLIVNVLCDSEFCEVSLVWFFLMKTSRTRYSTLTSIIDLGEKLATFLRKSKDCGTLTNYTSVLRRVRRHLGMEL